jgi:hypothetical protein
MILDPAADLYPETELPPSAIGPRCHRSYCANTSTMLMPVAPLAPVTIAV